MEQLTAGVWVHRIDAEGFPTVAALALTPTRAFVIDTLMRPQDMRPVLELLGERAGERRTVVVNTHHHWDHVYGNAAFPGVDTVGPDVCGELLHVSSCFSSRREALPPHDCVRVPPGISRPGECAPGIP